jgi:glycosyltransferase involved in cell wall biosynthesis
MQARPSFRISPRLAAYLGNLAPGSLVILNGIFHASVYSLSRLCRQHSIPYIIAPHDVYSPPMFRKSPQLKWVYWWLLEKRMLQQAIGVQVLDMRQAEWLKSLGVNAPFLEVPNGITDDSDFNPTFHSNRVPRLFFFGRMDIYHKGLDWLLEAVREIESEPIDLVIQGPDEGDRPRLEQLAQGMARVRFLEPEFERSAVAMMGEHDIFCLPSRFEGFGLAALEAMVAARVLLVSEASGIAPHVLASGCGVVVPPSVAGIKRGLRNLLERRQEWQQMGMQGRQYALERLDWRVIGAAALEEYERIRELNERGKISSDSCPGDF